MCRELKITERHLKFFIALFTVVSLVISATVSYALTSHQVEENKYNVKKLETTCSANTQELVETKIQLAKLKTIADDVKEIKQDVKELMKSR